MTLYLVGSAVLFVVFIFWYAYRQGKRIADLGALVRGNKLHNEVRKKIKEIDAKTKKKLRAITRSRALKFWLRGDKPEDP